MTVRGGQRLDRWMQKIKTRQSIAPSKIEVGFKDRRIAPLAAQLEFGNPSTNLPERPAFRMGIPDMQKVGQAMTRQVLKRDGGVITFKGASEIAIAMRDKLREVYTNYSGPGLSQRQIERKGHDDELIGAEGPKLIMHIKAYVDGREVG